MKVATLILIFGVTTGKPRFRSASIHPVAHHGHLTCDLSGKTLVMTGPTMNGETFDEAKKALVEYLKVEPFYKDWVLDRLED